MRSSTSTSCFAQSRACRTSSSCWSGTARSRRAGADSPARSCWARAPSSRASAWARRGCCRPSTCTRRRRTRRACRSPCSRRWRSVCRCWRAISRRTARCCRPRRPGSLPATSTRSRRPSPGSRATRPSARRWAPKTACARAASSTRARWSARCRRSTERCWECSNIGRMRILVTGVTGFVGSHLAEWALAQGAAVVGAVRWRSTTEHIDHLRDRLTLLGADLRALSSVRLLLEQARPDYIVHLAAQSFVGASWEAPSETLLTNAISQMNLFEAIRQLGATATRFLVIGSSEEYGLVYPDELPIRETNPLRPLSPYAVSKVTQDLMGYQYFKSYGLDIVRARAFNHSVGRHTPWLLRDDRTGLIDIRYIGELRRYKPTGYLSGRVLEDGTTVWDMRRHPVSVWADGRWSKVIHLSCHPLREGDRVLRLVSSAGSVHVTVEHSVMGPGPTGHDVRSASDLNVGDRLSLLEMPSSTGMWVHEDVAWLLGFFVAEGCITNGKVRIDNKDRKPLERCAEILLQHFRQASRFVQGSSGDVWRLSVLRPEEFARWLGPQVYASDHNKRVPRGILNAQPDAKLAFVRGYNEGDGLRAGHGTYEFKSFKTKSPILVLGLVYLVASTTRQRICLNTEVRSTGTYYLVNLNSPAADHANWGRHLEVPEDVLKKIEEVSYSGEVWDFETEDHLFHPGLGRT